MGHDATGERCTMYWEDYGGRMGQKSQFGDVQLGMEHNKVSHAQAGCSFLLCACSDIESSQSQVLYRNQRFSGRQRRQGDLFVED